MGQCDGSADRPVPTHAEIASVVEKENARRAIVSRWLAQERANQRIGSAWLEDHHPADVIELIRESGDTFLHGTVAEIRTALTNP